MCVYCGDVGSGRMIVVRVWRGVWAGVVHSDRTARTKSNTLWSFHTVENKVRGMFHKNPQN